MTCSSCECGCGGSCGCDVALAGEGFSRPAFFGGMLLTEDDLQAVVDYNVAKRRLTNRHTLGAGVVCGLDVTCHPCETGKVQVSPGYAIECCGNDILVSCPEDVDILELVRDLRVRQGVDCGEPCDKQPEQDYYLYVRYVEQPTDPVAPYAPDDCATGECEFSRVREGYYFELRCEGPDPVPTILDALEKCRPTDDDVRVEASTLASVVRIAGTFDTLVERLGEGPEPVPELPTKADFDRVEGEGDTVAFEEGLALVNRSNAVLAIDAAHAKGTAPSAGLNGARRELIRKRLAGLAVRLRAAPELAERPPEDVARIESVLATAEEQPDLSSLGPLERAWLSEGMSAAEAERIFVSGAERMRGTLLKTLDRRGQKSCDEYRTISRLRFDRLTTSSRESSVLLARSYLETLLDCVCGAFNPPCPTCTDNAVSLAKVRVDGCDVTHVCALERQWVLTPRALGYWFPVVELGRTILELLCCPQRRAEGADRDPSVILRQQLDEAGQTAVRAASTIRGAVGDRPELRPLLEAIGRPAPVTPKLSAVASRPVAEPSVVELQGRVEQLEKRLLELSGAQGDSP
jgi:hypothetical protein